MRKKRIKFSDGPCWVVLEKFLSVRARPEKFNFHVVLGLAKKLRNIKIFCIFFLFSSYFFHSFSIQKNLQYIPT